jgi:hypothetical protein
MLSAVMNKEPFIFNARNQDINKCRQAIFALLLLSCLSHHQPMALDDECHQAMV